MKRHLRAVTLTAMLALVGSALVAAPAPAFFEYISPEVEVKSTQACRFEGLSYKVGTKVRVENTQTQEKFIGTCEAGGVWHWEREEVVLTA